CCNKFGDSHKVYDLRARTWSPPCPTGYAVTDSVVSNISTVYSITVFLKLHRRKSPNRNVLNMNITFTRETSVLILCMPTTMSVLQLTLSLYPAVNDEECFGTQDHMLS